MAFAIRETMGVRAREQGSTLEGLSAPICIIGAGNISHVHAEVLTGLPNVTLAAVVDTNLEAAHRLARDWNIPSVYNSVAEALRSNQFQRAHVLVPPDRHLDAALPLLQAGKAVLVEKPLSVSGSDCKSLIAAAIAPGFLGVNQNFVYHPAFVRLKNGIDNYRFGNPRFVDVMYNMPLRQLANGQFGHWMFHAPENILLEQAIHPLSQIAALCGSVHRVRALPESRLGVVSAIKCVSSFTASFDCQRLPASLRFAVGQAFPTWQVRVVCDDGVLVADILANRFWTAGRTRWLDTVDGFLSGLRTALEIGGESARNLLTYGLSTMRLRGRSDGFFQSMSASLEAFHRSVDTGSLPPLDGAFGCRLVETCEALLREIVGSDRKIQRVIPAHANKAQPAEIVVLGGTGFIGRHLVSRLVEAERSVAVFARNTTNLPAQFQSELVSVRSGDIRDPKAVASAIKGSAIVINLAHGGGGDTWHAIKSGMVDGTERVAQACLAAGTIRLLHIGSIASLYLGHQSGPVTGATTPDPHSERRAFYARAKALCDEFLKGMHDRHNLPVCILRPGLVVGHGTSPFHSGLGFFNNEQHCIGWNLGLNPLPFVLVEDVVAAIVSGLDAKDVVGRSYNLVGDVRLTARQYLGALATTLGRPLRFHPKHPGSLFLDEIGKWAIKTLAGRQSPFPSWRDLLSRGLMAEFDCSDAKRDLGWCPVSDRAVFLQRAISAYPEMH